MNLKQGTIPDHVTKHAVAKVLAKLRADNRRVSFELAEVDMQVCGAFWNFLISKFDT